MTSFYDILYRRPGQMRASEQEAGPDNPDETALDEASGREPESAIHGSSHSFAGTLPKQTWPRPHHCDGRIAGRHRYIESP